MVSTFAKRVLEIAVGGVLLLILEPYFNTPEAVSRSWAWLTTPQVAFGAALQGLWVTSAVFAGVALLVGLLNWLNHARFSNVFATHSEMVDWGVKALAAVAAILAYVAITVALCAELGLVGLLVIIPGIAAAWKALRRAVWRFQHPLY